MSSTNKKIIGSSVVTHEGGNASRVKKEEELSRSIMSCLLWEDGFYEDGESIAERIARLTKEIEPMKAKLLLREAKFENKLRHTPLLMLTALAEAGTLEKELVAEICTRADDMTELLSIYWKNGKKPLSRQLQKGIALAFKKFDEYNLAKYNRDKSVKLRDVLRITHPHPDNDKQSELFKRVLTDSLEIPDTWEVAISACRNANEKKAAFERLITEGKLGDLAFVRNLRKMSEVGVDSKIIKDSFAKRNWRYILPFQFVTSARYNPSFEPQLEEAMLKCLESSEKYEGEVSILVDVSGSMREPVSAKSETKRIDVASGLAILARETFTNVDFFKFTSKAIQVPARRGFALRDAIGAAAGSTRMWNAIRESGKDKKRKIVIVITDEQTTDSGKFSDANADLLAIINVSPNKNGVCYEPGVIHINGWSENVITFLMKYIKVNKI